MICIQWKMESSYRSLVTKCCWFLCVVVIIAGIIVTYIMTYTQKTQDFLPASLPAQLTRLTNKETFLRGVPNFKSIVQSAQLPPITSVPRNRTGLFRYELSERDTEMFSDLLQTFHKILTNASIPYFMFEGSLLGSYRHHNLVPWDDDIDLILNEKHKQKIKELLQGAKSQYKLDTSTPRYKFYHTSGHVIGSHPWRSPFLDICFYNENPTQLWDNVLTKRYNKTDVFPLSDRPFLGYMYPGPHDPLRILQVNYNIDTCGTGTYNHTAEQRKDRSKVKTVPCSSLLDVIPFVQHVRGPGAAWCEEVLTFRGQIVNIFVRNSTNIPVC